MKKRCTEIDPTAFPAELQTLLRNCTLYDSSCSRAATVYYAETGYYIKTAAHNHLAREAEMGRLFYQKGLGVEVIHYISSDKDYLVTRSAPGEDLTHMLHDPDTLCGILASCLRSLHEQPSHALPRSPRFQYYEAATARPLPQAPWKDSWLTNRFLIHSYDEALEIARTGRHLLNCQTLIHGDACLPNVIQRGHHFQAFIDLDHAGAGDRHIDLYWAIWSLLFNLKTDAYTDRFLDLYGRELIQDDLLRVVAALELLE